MHSAMLNCSPLPEALSAYEQRRNEIARPIYDLNSQFATQEPPSAEMQHLLQALRTNPTERNRFLATIEGTISPTEFFAPEHVAHVLETAGL
jgi:2-polyprenyl-6-methoxyphenol hydroxylase-like FAD-dependent oxidoreductase